MMQLDQMWMDCDCGRSPNCKGPVIYDGELLPVTFNDMSDHFLDSCRDRSKEKGDDLEGWRFKVKYEHPPFTKNKVIEDADVVCPECVKVITNIEDQVYASDND